MSTISIPPAGSVARAPSTRAWIGRLRPGVVLAGLVLLYFIVAVIAPSVLATHSPYAVDLSRTLVAPSWAHPFGTDASGRDVYSQVVYGARQSLLIGVAATALSTAVGVILGFASGLAGGLVDSAINRAIEITFAFPVLLLALLFVTVWGPSATTEILAVGIGSAPGYARMIRGQVLAVKDSAYVEAARALGHPHGRIVRRHIFPNAMRPLVVIVTLGVGQSIVWASGLAFLGLGVAPPSPEWGALLDAGRDHILRAWWLEVMPGLAIVLFALAVTTLGRFVQQQLEGGTAR